MFSPSIKGSDLHSLELSRIERQSLYLTGVFFILTILFSAFGIASTIIHNVSLSSSLEKVVLVILAAAAALVAVLLSYWIDSKAISDRDKRSSLASTARLLALGASFAGAVCLPAFVARAVGPIEHIHVSASVGGPLCVAGFLGCLFGKLFRARVAKQAHTTAKDTTPKTTEVEVPVPQAKPLGRRLRQVSSTRRL